MKDKKIEEKLEITQEEIKTLKYVAKEMDKALNQQTQLPSGAPGLNQAGIKPKMWNELSIEEKVERMREQVKQYTLGIQQQISRLERQIHFIKRHTHNKDGKPIVEERLEEYYGHGGDNLLSQSSAKSLNNESYF